MNPFVISFYCLVVFCSLLYIYTRQKVKSSNDADFLKFQRTYLVVYLLAMAGDWLQGPYVYALYAHYGISKKDIEFLFVAGFGSSMVFGTFVGSFADKYGRRNNCILYGILYGLSCLTKHFNNFWILMVGRLLGGVATSILYSAFESWMINEHNKRGFDQQLQGTIFSHAVLGNSVVAILSGIVAQYAVDFVNYVAPFDIALGFLTIMCGLIICNWAENYGDTTINIHQSFKKAFNTIKTDRKVMCLGVIQSLFEGSMYCFVLEWTPALSGPGGASTSKTDGHAGVIPHGYIFAAFMVAIMIGSSLFSLLCKYFCIEAFMRPVFFVSALCLACPFIVPQSRYIIFGAFLIFESCVGIFWPAIGTLRGKYVPEETRATIMNFFRVPLNLLVVVILIQNLPITTVFTCCSLFLLISCGFQHWLYRESQCISKSDVISHDSGVYNLLESQPETEQQ